MTTAEAIRQPRGAFAALTVRSYRIYLAGQSLANTGSWMQSIAQDWLIFDLTHSSAAVGGQRHRVRVAQHQGPADLLLKAADVLADGRLLEAETDRGTGEAACLLHGKERGEQLRVIASHNDSQ